MHPPSQISCQFQSCCQWVFAVMLILFIVLNEIPNIKYVCDGGVVSVTWRPSRPSCDRRPLAAARSCQSADRTSSTWFSSDHTFLSTIDDLLQKTTCLSILTLTVRTSNISPGPKFTPGFSLWRLASYYYQWSGVLASGLSLPQIRFHKCFTIIVTIVS